MLKINNTPITTIESEYEYEFDVFESSNGLKCLNLLTPAEKRILIMYAETASYRKTAELLDCSAATVNNYINKIKIKLKEHGLSRDSFIG